MFIAALVVGLVEIGPGVCQMDLLNPDGTTNTSRVPCEVFVPLEEPTIPHRHPGGS